MILLAYPAASLIAMGVPGVLWYRARAKPDKCPHCGKRVSDQEYVVNWAACAECYGKHIDAHFSQRHVSSTSLSSSYSRRRVRELGKSRAMFGK